MVKVDIKIKDDKHWNEESSPFKNQYFILDLD
jgi:hypothetical protein